MKNTDTTEEINCLRETFSGLHINNLNCDCPECRNGKRPYIQILDMKDMLNI